MRATQTPFLPVGCTEVKVKGYRQNAGQSIILTRLLSPLRSGVSPWRPLLPEAKMLQQHSIFSTPAVLDLCVAWLCNRLLNETPSHSPWLKQAEQQSQTRVLHVDRKHSSASARISYTARHLPARFVWQSRHKTMLNILFANKDNSSLPISRDKESWKIHQSPAHLQTPKIQGLLFVRMQPIGNYV